MFIASNYDPYALRQDGSKPLTANWDAGSFDIKALSFTVGANTLNGSEFPYLDGQDQNVKVASSPTFNLLTLTELNLGQTGSNAATKLAVGLSATPTYSYPAYIEMITTPSFPAASTMNGVYSETSHLSTAMPSVGSSGFFFNTSSGNFSSVSSFKQAIGLYGGTITALSNTTTSVGARTVNLFGLYFNVYNAANWQPTGAVQPKIITTEGLFINSYLGYNGYTISGTAAKGVNYGANISGILAGTYGITGYVPVAGLNYGAYITTTDSLTNANGNITSYTLYLNGLTGSTKAGGGIVTAWDIYQANANNNALAGNTRIGGTTAPTVALDITGAGLFSTSLTVGTGFGCNSKTAQTAYASGGALSAYTTGAFGFDSDAHCQEIHTLLTNIRAALVANGIMS